MRFIFKCQDYQTEAVDAVVNIFNGQGFHDRANYILSIDSQVQSNNKLFFNSGCNDDLANAGFQNANIELSDIQLLENINKVQKQNSLETSSSLVNDLGACSLDVEMETGTGKTYVYIKTIFELNKRFGWSKFIIVVPSIAIREGVKKTFEMTSEHFMEYYGKKARYFIYDSSNLSRIDSFSGSPVINVMIINTQAFNTSFNEEKAGDCKAGNKAARKIFSKRDEFGSRRPIDVIKANRPILILDEPQKMNGTKTQKALQEFNPLFSLNYSATHAKQHNLIYSLDALDAFNKKLVKKIEVKGFEVKNLRGIDSYLYLEEIVLSPKNPPMAKIELEIKFKNSINREVRKLKVGDSCFDVSNNMEQYRGYTISEIDPTKGSITFTNGEVIETGEVSGDVSERDIRRIQIRETILSHFEKEERLYNKGIKCLSLFFIDEVAKYRNYDENGEEFLGEYGVIFEEEYQSILNNILDGSNSPYQNYLKSRCTNVKDVHKGYFSIDKSGRCINSKEKRFEGGLSDDISAYDLILKNKERLLSFDEPTRFIFSHSALREGWDNPNVFQICTLKHSNSNTSKRQEVGRGLRLCVNQDGSRMDVQFCGELVHDINILTVIASESYKTFVADIQSDIKSVLRDRPVAATAKYFEGMMIEADGRQIIIDDKISNKITRYLDINNYRDENFNITDEYLQAQKSGTLIPMSDDLKPYEEVIHKLIQAIYSPEIIKKMIDNAHQSKIKENPVNENFEREEFQKLWNEINHKYAYKVNFDSEELIQNAIENINNKLVVSELRYVATVGQQKSVLEQDEIERGESFTGLTTNTHRLELSHSKQIKYDLIGKITSATTLTRKTVSSILQGISSEKLASFKNNPEDFISMTARLINEQKATMIVEYITYDTVEGKYDRTIFTSEKPAQSFNRAYRAKRAIQDYVFTDGSAENSVERKFAKELDSCEEVCAYAKLPRGFQIPTPVGNYAPDWAIAFCKGKVKYIYFVAETKGSLSSMDFRTIEEAKINCAKKLFNESLKSEVKYEVVDSYDALMDIVQPVENTQV